MLTPAHGDRHRIDTLSGKSRADVKHTTTSSLKTICLVGLVELLISAGAPGESLTVPPPASSASLAFARYIASTHERDPFTESGPVGVKIEASLPDLYKDASLLAIRDTGDSERSEYRVVQAEGDAIVAQEVIARYFLVQQQLEGLPFSSVAVTPANYKFRCKGAVGTGRAFAYVYQITPRNKRAGLLQGQMWIDSMTGEAILLAGRFVKAPSMLPGKIEMVRNTELMEDGSRMRVTHLTIETRNAGRGDLNIVEIPLSGQVIEPRLSPAPLVEQ